MYTALRGPTAALALLVAGLAVPDKAALAQALNGVPSNAGSIATGRQADAAKVKPAPTAPAALPGAKANAPVAPATKAPSEMEPTEALFDAINRGDLAAARDAVNRGADLRAVNVLGMTPIELAVDLWRSDISFLLLSMRGDDSGKGPPQGGAANLLKTAGNAKPAPAPKTPPRQTTQVAKVSAQNPIPGPKLWTNDGGTPQPSNGFLGFGNRQASN